MKKLNSLDPGKSMGLDGCHPYFLYSLRDVRCVPLRILYNKSLKEGVVATQWLEACITGIHKKGPKNLASNYRPVSIMTSYMQDDGVHYTQPDRCTHVHTTTTYLDTDVNTDFAKAFDSVPHERLSLKLKANGIEGDVLKWIQSFLTGRRHRVYVDGELFDWIYVISGIPQGSVLGQSYS